MIYDSLIYCPDNRQRKGYTPGKIKGVRLCSLSQGLHRHEKLYAYERFLEKSLKIKSALKIAGESLKCLEKSLNFTIFLFLNAFFGAVDAPLNKGATFYKSLER